MRILQLLLTGWKKCWVKARQNFRSKACTRYIINIRRWYGRGGRSLLVYSDQLSISWIILFCTWFARDQSFNQCCNYYLQELSLLSELSLLFDTSLQSTTYHLSECLYIKTCTDTLLHTNICTYVCVSVVSTVFYDGWFEALCCVHLTSVSVVHLSAIVLSVQWYF